MKKIKMGLLILLSIALITTFGCNLLGNNSENDSENESNSNTTQQLSDQEKAETVSKAVTESSENVLSSNQGLTLSKDFTYTVSSSGDTTTVTDNEGGTLTATRKAEPGNLFSNSQFESEIETATNPMVLSFTYSNFHLAVKDDEENEVDVVLNGTMSMCMVMTSSGETLTSVSIIFYGNVSGRVGEEEFSNYAVDIEYKVVHGDNGESSFTIKGTANGEEVNITLSGGPVPIQ